MRVTVIDYGAGNLASVLKALRHLGAAAEVSSGDLAPIEHAERIVLPGVGHFAATGKLDETGMTSAVRAAIARGVPFLGICVGMQWLYAGSTEAPGAFRARAFRSRLHAFFRWGGEVAAAVLGWNSLEPRIDSRLLRGVDSGDYVYFTRFPTEPP